MHACLTDLDDDHWRLMYTFEKLVDPAGVETYAFVGLVSLYEYFGYPNLVRPRISQVVLRAFACACVCVHLCVRAGVYVYILAYMCVCELNLGSLLHVTSDTYCACARVCV